MQKWFKVLGCGCSVWIHCMQRTSIQIHLDSICYKQVNSTSKKFKQTILENILDHWMSTKMKKHQTGKIINGRTTSLGASKKKRKISGNKNPLKKLSFSLCECDARFVMRISIGTAVVSEKYLCDTFKRCMQQYHQISLSYELYWNEIATFFYK